MSTQMQTHVINGVEIHTSSDNVFADLGLPNAKELKAKSTLMIAIERTMRDLGLSRQAAARRLGLAPAQLSALLRGDFDHVSERALTQYLRCLEAGISTRSPVGQVAMAA